MAVKVSPFRAVNVRQQGGRDYGLDEREGGVTERGVTDAVCLHHNAAWIGRSRTETGTACVRPYRERASGKAPALIGP